MAKYIRINPNHMRICAVRMREQAKVLDEAVARMDRLQSQLQSEWEGAASEAFAAHYFASKHYFVRMEETIQELSMKLERYVRLIEELDASLG